MIFSILATGPSMSQAVADRARELGSVLAVNDAFELAPWADGLVANDINWWRARPHAKALHASMRIKNHNGMLTEAGPLSRVLKHRQRNSGAPGSRTRRVDFPIATLARPTHQ